MNNQLTHLGQNGGYNPNGRNVPNGAMDVWNQGGGGNTLGMPVPAAPATPAASPVAVVQRLLRGRVALAVVLAGVGGIIGASAGYMSQVPKYSAQGAVLISPAIIGPDTDKYMPQYEKMMTTEALTMASPGIIGDVPKYEPWKSLMGDNKAALGDLAANLKSVYTKNTFTIGMEYTNVDPKVASAGMQAVLQSYRNQYKENSGDALRPKLDEQQSRVDSIRTAYDARQNTINDLTAKYGTIDLTPLVTAAEQKVEYFDSQLRGQLANYQAATDAIQANKANGNKIPVEDLATVDTNLAKMLSDLRAYQLRAQLDERQLGPNNRTVIAEKASIAITQGAIDSTADTLRQTILAIVPDFVKGDMMKITRLQYAGLETRVNTLKNDLKKAKEDRDAINNDAAKVQKQQQEMRRLEGEMAEKNQRLADLKFQAAMTGDLKILADGSQTPSMVQNKKILAGMAGAMGGACVPVALLMLLGLMDTRFRYSDDAAGHSMSGIPLLGILPNLPDRLTDPAQASIAAHCVHQIRTMLQLNSMREHSTVFSVTSASSGDGKTSLSLALGLSFAASGSRTLLIDADLVGGGLTSRLGNDTAVGIVDALAGVGLEECVQPTDVADLSLLPIGSAQAHHAGSFSPPAVRKLLNEIRKHYEVIIVDTGPVMGSIEATPICASVDGVVLTVARGQSRPLVERAITHLQSIGAKVSGVVFNRAQHKDFEQSIGAISIRSAARTSAATGTGHNRQGGGLGAVASAVHGSVNRDA